jgi:hypothetical protein
MEGRALMCKHYQSFVWSLLLLLLLLDTPDSQADIVMQYHGGSVTFLAHRYGASARAYRSTLPLGIHHVPPADEYYLDFWLKYRAGWLEGAGGKIAGLAGGEATSGCRSIAPHGWSVRYMWAPLKAYLYYQDRRSACGESDHFSPETLGVNRWHRLTQRVRINTPNVRNGIVQFWVDGRQVYSRTNLRLRGAVSRNTARVDRVIIQPFRGGNDASWSVARETTIDFSTFYLLDCLPMFAGGSPTTPPQCTGDADLELTDLEEETVDTEHGHAAPRNLRIMR